MGNLQIFSLYTNQLLFIKIIPYGKGLDCLTIQNYDLFGVTKTKIPTIKGHYVKELLLSSYSDMELYIF